MRIKLFCFGISKDIIGESQHVVDGDWHTIGELKDHLCQLYPEFTRLTSLKFAVNEHYQDDSYELSNDQLVAIIPPVSGG